MCLSNLRNVEVVGSSPITSTTSGMKSSVRRLGTWATLGRSSLLKCRQHLLNEAGALSCEPPESIRSALPDTSEVRPRLVALADRDRSMSWMR